MCVFYLRLYPHPYIEKASGIGTIPEAFSCASHHLLPQLPQIVRTKVSNPIPALEAVWK